MTDAATRIERFEAFLEALAALDPEQMLALFHPEGRWELPYAPIESGRCFTGRRELADFISGIPEAFDHLSFTKPTLRAIDHEAALVAEYTGSGRVSSSGRDYANTYIVVVEFDGDLITLLREYYDPVCIMDAFGGLEAMAALS